MTVLHRGTDNRVKLALGGLLIAITRARDGRRITRENNRRTLHGLWTKSQLDRAAKRLEGQRQMLENCL